MGRVITFTAVAALAAALLGCQAVAAPWIIFGEEPTRFVPAEYPHLSGKTSAIFVWADHDTLFQYPHVQFELASFVEAALRAAVKDAKLVAARKSVDFQRQNPDWDRMHPARLAARLGADRALMIELTQYTTREPESPHVYRGHVAANVKVYDSMYPDAVPAYRSEIAIAYPPDGPGAWGVSDDEVRRESMKVFADELAGKFHDRRVKVK